MDLPTLIHRLLKYFSTVGAPREHLFTLSDINLLVMMNAYGAEERDLLAVALAALGEDGTLRSISPTSYRLTEAGLLRIEGVRTTLRGSRTTREVVPSSGGTTTIASA